MAQFIAPGMAASEAFTATLLQREALARQAMLDDLRKQEAERLAANDAVTRKVQEENAASLAAEREARAETARLQQQKVKEDTVRARRRMGDRMTADDLALAPELGEAELTLPGKTAIPMMALPQAQSGTETGEVTGAAPAAPAAAIPFQAMPQAPTGEMLMRGTPEERMVEEALNSGALTPEQEQFLRLRQAMGTGGSVPAELFKPAADLTKPIVRLDANRERPEMLVNGKWEPVTGEIPKDAQVTVIPRETSGSGGTPYWQTVQMADGVWMINTRNPQERMRVGDLKPGATESRDIQIARAVNENIRQVKTRFTPSYVGVIAGRLKDLDSRFWGSDPDYAAFKQNLTQIANTIINLRTGAQMSIQETQRILAEIADPNTPVTTFQARLAELERQYREYEQRRATFAFGRLTGEKIDAMTGTTAPGVITAPGGTPGPTTQPRSAKDLIDSVLGAGAK